MDSTLRRNTILDTINKSDTPISASVLAKDLNVSRQVIVGDVAFLRAQGNEIIATARGYIAPTLTKSNQYIGKIACCHSTKDTETELRQLVDCGAIVMNVIIEHEIYGEIAGQLNIKTHEDIDVLMKRIHSSNVKLLSELKSGIHLHTIACRDKTHFEQICAALDDLGFLFKG